MGEDEVYLVTVYTGHGLGSGTSANVCIELNGTVCSSRVSVYKLQNNYSVQFLAISTVNKIFNSY